MLTVILLIIAIILIVVFGYLNIHYISKKDNPSVIINNLFQDFTESEKKGKFRLKDSTAAKDGTEVPIENITTVKSIEGDVNLSSESIGETNVSKFTKKIKDLRNKK
jgi:hypothetical protein